MKPKFLDFSAQGIVCPVCRMYSAYIGCDYHIGNFPKLVRKETYIRIPNCPNCKIECSNCNRERNIPDFLKVFEAATKEKRPVRKPKKQDSIEILPTTVDRLTDANLRSIRDLDLFRNATYGALELLFCFDVGSQLGIKDIEEKLVKMKMDIPLELAPINRVNSKLSALLYCLLMLRAAGLEAYEDEIMKAEIGRIYDKKHSYEELKTLLKGKEK